MEKSLLDKNRFLSASWDHTIKLWQIDTKECTHTFTGHTEIVPSVCRLDENRFLSGSYDKTIKLWQVPNLTLKDYCNFFPFFFDSFLFAKKKDGNGSKV